MEKKFKIGDVVCLNSGSPKMTVERYVEVMGKGTIKMEETTKVECYYYEGTVKKKVTHEQDALTLYIN
jgi:uncharacterized protein YodC (DUF2158 family)